ncbi:MAG: hypothetical protein K0U93_02345 [Gammaproteobacteria bacterium]|nr:hypothetical protein [Gammaproteobacteria bacterium]
MKALTERVRPLVAVGVFVLLALTTLISPVADAEDVVIEDHSISLDPQWLKQLENARPGQSIYLPFVDGQSLTLRTRSVRRFEEGFSWVADTTGKDSGGVTLSVTNLGVIGWIDYGGERFRLFGNAKAGYVLREIDTWNAPEPSSDDTVPGDTSSHDDKTIWTSLEHAKSGIELLEKTNRLEAAGIDITDLIARLEPDDGSVIDVLIVYTPAAEEYFYNIHGQNWRYEFGMQIDQVNRVFNDSGVETSLRLVNNSPIDYRVKDPTLLDDLLSLQAGDVDDVKTLRDAHRADLVVLVVNNDIPLGSASKRNCGRGFYLSDIAQPGQDPLPFSGKGLFANKGFSVVDADCIFYGYTLAHEIGHNLSAHHDHYALAQQKKRFNRAGRTFNIPSPSYARGFNLVGPQVRTVMSYADFCRDIMGVTCPVIGRFSNPQAPYDQVPHVGYPTGIADMPNSVLDATDNVRAMNRAVWTVANFRSSTFGPFP